MRKPTILNYIDINEDGTLFNNKTGKNIGHPIGKKFYITLPVYGTVSRDWLVASAFCEKALNNEGKPYDNYRVIHKNGNSLDDRAENLEWLPIIKKPKKEVNKDPNKPKRVRFSYDDREFYVIDTFRKDWEVFDTIADIARAYQISPYTVRSHLRYKRPFKGKYLVTDDICDTIYYTT